MTSPASRKPTIYSIAQAVGVSPSTVSRALSRPELVKDSVREAVLADAYEEFYAAWMASPAASDY